MKIFVKDIVLLGMRSFNAVFVILSSPGAFLLVSFLISLRIVPEEVKMLDLVISLVFSSCIISKTSVWGCPGFKKNYLSSDIAYSSALSLAANTRPSVLESG